jgi:hypothetical protein
MEHGQRTDSPPSTDRRGSGEHRVSHETEAGERGRRRATCLVPNCEMIILSDTLAPGRNPGILQRPTLNVCERPLATENYRTPQHGARRAPMHARIGVRVVSTSPPCTLAVGGRVWSLCLRWSSTRDGPGQTGAALDLLGDLLDELLVGRLGHLQRHLHLSTWPPQQSASLAATHSHDAVSHDFSSRNCLCG